MRGDSSGLMLGYIQEFWYSTAVWKTTKKDIKVAGLRADT